MAKVFFFWQECALACNLVVVLSCCFFLKVCEEVRLSRIFLRGGWFDVGVDESQQKEDEKSLFPSFFGVLLGLTNQCCVWWVCLFVVCAWCGVCDVCVL